MVEPRRALLLGLGASPLSSHATAKPRPSRSSFESQTPQGAGRHFVSYLDQDLSNATNRSQRPPTFSSRHFGQQEWIEVGLAVEEGVRS